MIDEWKKGAKYWDHAWNPVIGCRKISEGCANCYAAGMAERFPELQDDDGGFAPHAPKGDKRPPKHGVVFVGNMTDLFGHWNDPLVIQYWLSRMNPNAINLVLTKRAERLSKMLCGVDHGLTAWFGITAENQERLVERLPALFAVKKRWISLEPLLGEIDFREAMAVCNDIGDDFTGIVDWVVVGAESGPNRRPCNIEWVRSIVHQCQAAGIKVFVKQIDIDGKLEKDISKFPADLQIRQVPWREK